MVIYMVSQEFISRKTQEFMDDPCGNESITIAKSMIKYGGGFVRKLGYALLSADHVNTQKIRDTFPEYWQQYLSLANKDGDINA